MRASRTILFGAILSGIVTFPQVAVAEVMDKEPTLVATWAWALVGGALGLVGWRWRWWAGAVLVLLPAAYFTGLHFELTDPYVGPDIVREAGRGYVLWSYSAAAVFIVLQVAGVWHVVRGRPHVATRRWSGPAPRQPSTVGAGGRRRPTAEPLGGKDPAGVTSWRRP